MKRTILIIMFIVYILLFEVDIYFLCLTRVVNAQCAHLCQLDTVL